MSAVAKPPPKRADDVARRKTPVPKVQVNIRVDKPFHDRLERIAERLGIEVTGLMRMVIMENIGPYEERARQAGLPPYTEGHRS